MTNAEPDTALVRDFDPSHLPPEFYADPYPTYRALRELSPVHRCPDGSWFLTRYGDLESIYRSREHFSSDKKAAFGPKYGLESPLYEHHTTSLVFNDPPYHTRVRRQIVGALTPPVVRAMEPGLASLIQTLLDRIEARGRFDVIEDFAAAIPVEVIGNLLRIPHEERGPLRGWSLAILGALEPVLSETQRELGERSVVEFREYLRMLVTARRAHLRDDDLLSRLIREQEGGDWLTEQELLHNCVFLLNAGHETTTNLIGNAVHLLITHPHELERLRREPGLIASTIEECLRCESPNQLGNRLVTEAIEVRGTPLPAGAYLTLCIGAANRDPEEFPDADRFDIGRSPNRHLAFAAGAHACAGMSVARFEAQIAIGRIVARFPRVRLEGEPVRGGRARFRGFRSLRAVIE
jgi:cytochrome P450